MTSSTVFLLLLLQSKMTSMHNCIWMQIKLQFKYTFIGLPHTLANMRRKHVSQPGLKSTFQSYCFLF
ncbi:hypothetical protein DAI22_03g286400 [Oryza sativa Japonica Group]|nr:hypothetical protein DAI22_03g286400 [Oryza sativa Japonica Group]